MEGLRTVHVSNTLSKLLLDTLKPDVKTSGLIHLLHPGGVMEAHGYCHGNRAAHTAVCLRKYSRCRAMFRLSLVSDQINIFVSIQMNLFAWVAVVRTRRQ